ncbi:hypothetical protein F4781DRAFT_429506 [Annulohypoxylon bovei var. microspora]|nr:hypothetical protein F4781DRAFT_429506 [Annulohypoxylon bovei var. microspora]
MRRRGGLSLSHLNGVTISGVDAAADDAHDRLRPIVLVFASPDVKAIAAELVMVLLELPIPKTQTPHAIIRTTIIASQVPTGPSNKPKPLIMHTCRRDVVACGLGCGMGNFLRLATVAWSISISDFN